MSGVAEKMFGPVGAYCDWYGIFDEADRYIFEQGLRNIEQVFVLVSLLFCTYGYCQGGLLHRKTQSVESHANLEFYFAAIYIRSVTMTLSNLELIQEFVQVWFDPCHFFAFWETFSAVLEFESLTHVCIERYVIAKYITLGLDVPREHYTMYFYLSMMFSFVYAVFFVSDFSGCMCMYDLMLPETWKRRFILAIYLFRSVKPALIMIVSLTFAWLMEQNFTAPMKARADTDFTKIIIAVTAVNMICWFPFAVIRSWVLFTRYMYIDVGIPAPSLEMRWFIWIHCSAPIVAMLTVVIIDVLTRCNPTYLALQHQHQD